MSRKINRNISKARLTVSRRAPSDSLVIMASWLHFENNASTTSIPARDDFIKWVSRTLDQCKQSPKPLSIIVVGDDEMQRLNNQYRAQDKSTNVLSFPYQALLPEQSELGWGDIVICAQVVASEAQQQHKELVSHWAHMTIHGMLHLLGYDHQTDVQASLMESLEIELMSKLGYANPYLSVSA